MSRRVFDVGLDVDRIKNGLRLHSVNRHNKNHRSASVSYAPSGTPAENQFDTAPQLEEKRSDPTFRRENGRPLSGGGDTPAALPPINPPKVETTLQPALQSPIMNSSHAPSDDHVEPLHSPSDDDAQSFDLRPPPPKKSVQSLETFSEQLFSSDHLRTILQDPTYFIRFTAFLNRYRPNSAFILTRWLEAQKAIKAVEYANALAEGFKPMPGEQSNQGPCLAATLDKTFETRSKRALEALVNDCLSAYVTQAFTKVVTESMVREITGSTMPAMRDLVGGLAEVFCLSDPSQRDNPIIYASEEFYRTTQYGKDYVLGRNCRFLQGPRTDRTTIARIKDAVKTGQESSETILNYRRDGSPFMNLVMTAPLYDNKGIVRYFIGAQVDISGLVEEGRGLDSFEKYINEHRRNRHANKHSSTNQKCLKALDEFGQMLSVEESNAIRGSAGQSREGSINESEHGSYRSNRSTQNRRGDPNTRQTRRVLGNEDTEDEQERDQKAWAFTSLGPSGKLPGVYQNYLLLRPHPSLRIIFVSPALRIPGLLQSPFLSRIGGPSHVRAGLADALERGEGITAKVTWLPQARSDVSETSSLHQQQRNQLQKQDSAININNNNSSNPSRPNSSRADTVPTTGGKERKSAVGKTRYISLTPLLGSDDRVGVWIVIMVENEIVTGSLPSRHHHHQHHHQYLHTSSSPSDPSKPKFSSSSYERHDPGRLYADFMRNQRDSGLVEREEELLEKKEEEEEEEEVVMPAAAGTGRMLGVEVGNEVEVEVEDGDGEK